MSTNGVASISALDRNAEAGMSGTAHARIAAGVPGGRVPPAEPASLRHWLEQIVATLPEPRQRMYDLFVARGLDTPSAALELGSGVAEVRRLRHENRQAVLRAFEVTALAAADEPWHTAPRCGELRQMLAAGQHDGTPREGGQGPFVVLSAALRVSLARHLSQCTACQDRRDDCMASWAPQLLAIMDGAERHEQAAQALRLAPEPGRHGPAPGAHRRVSSAGPARTVTARRAVAAGAGVLAALPLLAFAWPGFLHGKHGPAVPSAQAVAGRSPSSIGAPRVAGAAVSDHGPVHRAPPGLLSTPSPQATASTSAQLHTALPPSAYYTLQSSPTPTPSLGQETPGTSPSSAPPPPAAPSSPQPRKTSPAPRPATSTAPSSHAPTATPTSTSSSAPSPTPSATASAPASATPSSPAPSSPDASASAADPAPSSDPASTAPAPAGSAAS